MCGTGIIARMGTRDQLHPQVVSALRKDGWTITHDPSVVPFAATYTEIDLGAEKLIAAEKGGRRIAVEVKSFMGPSTVSEFHTALGQYLDYTIALSEHDPERSLYLAIPQFIHRTFFADEMVRRIVERFGLRLLVFNPQTESVVLWTR
jgi:hypothetical protein